MADAYVQVLPDSTGKKIQAFENTLDLTNAVEAQATVNVNAQGVETGSVGNPMKFRNYRMEELLQLLVAEARITNMYLREINPKILADENTGLLEHDIFISDTNG